ncbi:DUF563 domain-containing protein [uncultured Hymenobacter sp.]|uniref:glycosyltransferase family 61 protein n=1 Tax=uncultured Hymenobacter sp. TaxID=170016 RepID=UPI0035CA7969
MRLIELAGNAKTALKKALLSASKNVWRAPLTRANSIDLLKDSVVFAKQSPPVHLPKLAPVNAGNVHHPEEIRAFRPDYVWQVTVGGPIQSLTICRSGGLLANKKWLLDLDFTSTAGLLDSPIKKKWDKYPLVIAPWSHFWKGFYDYTTFVVGKLCRIESVYGPDIWQQAKICYPLQHTQYEREFLEKLGIPKSSIIDTAPYWGTAIEAESVIVANNHLTWCSSLSDMMLLRNRFRSSLPIAATEKKKLYLSRKGRRRVLNEGQVREIMATYGIEVIEDEPHSLDEQIHLFQNASVIVAPHGAALTNLLWCDEGTQVMEFFAGSYTPNFYYYMCTMLGLKYDFLVDYSAGSRHNHWANVADDIVVDIDTLKDKLNQILLQEQSAVHEHKTLNHK